MLSVGYMVGHQHLGVNLMVLLELWCGKDTSAILCSIDCSCHSPSLPSFPPFSPFPSSPSLPSPPLPSPLPLTPMLRAEHNMFCAVGKGSVLFCRAMMTFEHVSSAYVQCVHNAPVVCSPSTHCTQCSSSGHCSVPTCPALMCSLYHCPICLLCCVLCVCCVVGCDP